jgi:GTPase
VVFVNDPRLVSRDYERFLLNRLRQALPFEEIPIRLWMRSRRPRSVAR